MRPEHLAGPSLKEWATTNRPSVVYPGRPEDQQERGHVLYGELLYRLVLRRLITSQQFYNHKILLRRVGLQEIENLNVFYRCENCIFQNTKLIVTFSEAVEQLALEWNVPYSKYSEIFDQLDNHGISRILNWQAAI